MSLPFTQHDMSSTRDLVGFVLLNLSFSVLLSTPSLAIVWSSLDCPFWYLQCFLTGQMSLTEQSRNCLYVSSSWLYRQFLVAFVRACSFSAITWLLCCDVCYNCPRKNVIGFVVTIPFVFLCFMSLKLHLSLWYFVYYCALWPLYCLSVDLCNRWSDRTMFKTINHKYLDP